MIQPPGSNQDYIDDMEHGLLDQAKQIKRLGDLIRTLRHRQWPEGAPQNCEVRETFDAETESMIQVAIDSRRHGLNTYRRKPEMRKPCTRSSEAISVTASGPSKPD